MSYARAGSSPAFGTIFKKALYERFFCFCLGVTGSRVGLSLMCLVVTWVLAIGNVVGAILNRAMLVGRMMPFFCGLVG